ncbi:MAG: hypothetical protein Q9217_000703 [Psora testacea]
MAINSLGFTPEQELMRNDDDRTNELRATLITLIPLSVIAVLLRLISRRMSKARLWWDDWMTVVALIFSLGLIVDLLLGADHGLGKHAELAGMPNVIYGAKKYTRRPVYTSGSAVNRQFSDESVDGCRDIVPTNADDLEFACLMETEDCSDRCVSAWCLQLSLTDPTYTDVPSATWTPVECSVAVISACLPTLKPLFRSMLNLPAVLHVGIHDRKTTREHSDITTDSLPAHAKRWRAQANVQRIYDLTEMRRGDEESAQPSREQNCDHEDGQRPQERTSDGSTVMYDQAVIESPHLYARDHVKR